MASEQKLSLIVDLVNKTESQFKAIGDDFTALSKRTEKMSDAFGSMAKVGTVAFAAIAGIGVGALKAYASAEREMVAANVAVENAIGTMTAKQRQASTGFKDAGQALSAVKAKMAEVSTAAIQLGFDDEAVAVSFGKLYQVSGDLAQAQSDVALAMDLAAFSGKDIEATTRAITMSYAGGAKVLKEFGIQLEDGATKAEILAAVQVKAGGAAAKAAATLSGQLAILQTNLQNIAEDVGQALAPALIDLLKTLTPIIKSVGEWVKENPKLVSGMILAAGAIAGVVAVVGTLGLAMLSLGKAIAVARVALALLMSTAGIWITVISLAVIAVYKLYNAFTDLADEVGGAGNAVKLTLQEMHTELLELARGAVKALDTVLGVIPGMGDALSGVLSSLDKSIELSNGTFAEMATRMTKVGQSSSDMSSKISTEIPKATTAINVLPTATKAAADAAKKNFEDMVSAVSDIKKNIMEVYAEIKQAALDYTKSVGGEQKSFEQDVVATVANANVEKKKLEQELQEAASSGDVSRIRSVQDSLNEQLAIITTYQQSKLKLDAEIANEQARLGMNELQRMIFDHAQKLTLMQTEYMAEQAQRAQRIVDLQAEQTQILAMVSKQKAAKILAEAEKGQSVRDRIAADKLAEKNWLAESVTAYQNYANTIGAIMASISGARSTVSTPAFNFSAPTGKRASGGAVQPGRTFLVGEKGPELFTAQQYGSITANGSGGNVTLVITGNSFYGEEDMVDKIGASIMKSLQKNIKL